MVGLISIIVLTAKTKWLALLAFFPPTHPLALIAIVRKQGSASLVPLGAYALAAVTWFSGSHRIYQEQLHQPEQYEQALKADGEPLGFELYRVGLNGKDDGGRYQTKTPRDGSRQADDLLLIHLPISQSLPKYQLGNRKG